MGISKYRVNKAPYLVVFKQRLGGEWLSKRDRLRVGVCDVFGDRTRHCGEEQALTNVEKAKIQDSNTAKLHCETLLDAENS